MPASIREFVLFVVDAHHKQGRPVCCRPLDQWGSGCGLEVVVVAELQACQLPRSAWWDRRGGRPGKTGVRPSESGSAPRSRPARERDRYVRHLREGEDEGPPFLPLRHTTARVAAAAVPARPNSTPRRDRRCSINSPIETSVEPETPLVFVTMDHPFPQPSDDGPAGGDSHALYDCSVTIPGVSPGLSSNVAPRR